MPLQFADRVRVLTNTVGTGVLTLGASLPGLQGFSGVIATGNTVQYAIEDGFQWEIGIGTFTDNPPLLDRSSVQYSSDGAGVAIALSGSAQVFVTPNAQWFNQLNSLNIGLLPGGVLSGALTVQVPNVAIGAYDPDPGHANALGLQPSGGLYLHQRWRVRAWRAVRRRHAEPRPAISDLRSRRGCHAGDRQHHVGQR